MVIRTLKTTGVINGIVPNHSTLFPILTGGTVIQVGRWIMNVADVANGLICVGDYVVDRIEVQTFRRTISGEQVRRIMSFTIHDELHAGVNMADGGVMGLHEIKPEDIRLESEVTG